MKVLFIFHEYNHTGSTLVLYRNILWLKNHGIEANILITGYGSFENQIKKLGKYFYWNEIDKPSSKRNLLTRVLSKLYRYVFRVKPYLQILLEDLRNENFDLIYANSICSSIFINELNVLNIPVIWHIHEQELAIKVIGSHHLESYKFADEIIANSNATKINLIKNHNCNPDKITVVYPGINIHEILKVRDGKNNIRKDLDLPDDSFIIGTSGTVFSRKGCNAFLILVKLLEHLLPMNKFLFIWVGNNLNPVEIEHDLELSGMRQKVKFTGNIDNPFSYYSIFDVFVSLSKEESFGLAAVEASLFEIPIIFFDKVEGLSEIFSDKTGGNIPYLDLVAMATRIIELYENSELRKSLGKEAKNIGSRFDENLVMPELLRVLSGARNFNLI